MFLNLRPYIPLVLVIVLAIALTFLLLNSASKRNAERKVSKNPVSSLLGESTQTVEDVEELKIETLSDGEGEEAVVGDTVSVNYRGTLLDGTQFDSSYERDAPFQFTLGENRVIQGWEQGVLGMKVGEKRKLTIPSVLGYGEVGSPPAIPASAGLIFEIELLEIK